jgi:hypothetical protein
MVQKKIDDRRVQDRRSIELFARNCRADDRKDAGAYDRADTKCRQ